MAYYSRVPALFIIMLLIFLTSAAARSLLQAPPQRIFKLDLARLDSPHAGMLSYAHLQHALQRTSLQLARFQYLLQLHGGGQLDTSSSSSYSSPVFGDVGAFLTTLSIGTPPVSFHVVVDTGSSLVWVQCKPCSSCFNNAGDNSIFDPSLSTSYSMLPCSNPLCAPSLSQGSCATSSCSYKTSYGDHSYTIGDLSLDTLTLSDPSGTAQHIPNFAFGCGHNNQLKNSNNGGADGIVGLDLGPISLPSQLGVSYLSYCLQPLSDPASKKSSLYLGDVAQVPTSSNGMTLSTSFFRNPVIDLATFYYVKLNGISVNGQLVPGTANGAFDVQADGSGGIVFDSGTTLTLLRSDTYNAVADAFTSTIALPPTSTTPFLCYSLSSASNIQFPSLTFHFEGADLELPLQNYFLPFQNDNVVCLTLTPSSQTLSIFGNMQQQNLFITYDLNAHTLSLTPTTCDS